MELLSPKFIPKRRGRPSKPNVSDLTTEAESSSLLAEKADKNQETLKPVGETDKDMVRAKVNDGDASMSVPERRPTRNAQILANKIIKEATAPKKRRTKDQELDKRGMFGMPRSQPHSYLSSDLQALKSTPNARSKRSASSKIQVSIEGTVLSIVGFSLARFRERFSAQTDLTNQASSRRRSVSKAAVNSTPQTKKRPEIASLDLIQSSPANVSSGESDRSRMIILDRQSEGDISEPDSIQPRSSKKSSSDQASPEDSPVPKRKGSLAKKGASKTSSRGRASVQDADFKDSNESRAVRRASASARTTRSSRQLKSVPEDIQDSLPNKAEMPLKISIKFSRPSLPIGEEQNYNGLKDAADDPRSISNISEVDSTDPLPHDQSFSRKRKRIPSIDIKADRSMSRQSSIPRSEIHSEASRRKDKTVKADTDPVAANGVDGERSGSESGDNGSTKSIDLTPNPAVNVTSYSVDKKPISLPNLSFDNLRQHEAQLMVDSPATGSDKSIRSEKHLDGNETEASDISPRNMGRRTLLGSPSDGKPEMTSDISDKAGEFGGTAHGSRGQKMMGSIAPNDSDGQLSTALPLKSRPSQVLRSRFNGDVSNIASEVSEIEDTFSEPRQMVKEGTKNDILSSMVSNQSSRPERAPSIAISANSEFDEYADIDEKVNVEQRRSFNEEDNNVRDDLSQISGSEVSEQETDEATKVSRNMEGSIELRPLCDEDLPGAYESDEALEPPQNHQDNIFRVLPTADNFVKALEDPERRSTADLLAITDNAVDALVAWQAEWTELDAQIATATSRKARNPLEPQDLVTWEDKKEADLYGFRYDPNPAKAGAQDIFGQRYGRYGLGRELRRRGRGKREWNSIIEHEEDALGERRGRGRPRRNVRAATELSEASVFDSAGGSHLNDPDTPYGSPGPRKRGRGRLTTANLHARIRDLRDGDVTSQVSTDSEGSPAPTRRRGRPSKAEKERSLAAGADVLTDDNREDTPQAGANRAKKAKSSKRSAAMAHWWSMRKQEEAARRAAEEADAANSEAGAPDFHDPKLIRTTPTAQRGRGGRGRGSGRGRGASRGGSGSGRGRGRGGRGRATLPTTSTWVDPQPESDLEAAQLALPSTPTVPLGLTEYERFQLLTNGEGPEDLGRGRRRVPGSVSASASATPIQSQDMEGPKEKDSDEEEDGGIRGKRSLAYKGIGDTSMDEEEDDGLAKYGGFVDDDSNDDDDWET